MSETFADEGEWVSRGRLAQLEGESEAEDMIMNGELQTRPNERNPNKVQFLYVQQKHSKVRGRQRTFTGSQKRKADALDMQHFKTVVSGTSMDKAFGVEAVCAGESSHGDEESEESEAGSMDHKRGRSSRAASSHCREVKPVGLSGPKNQTSASCSTTRPAGSQGAPSLAASARSTPETKESMQKCKAMQTMLQNKGVQVLQLAEQLKPNKIQGAKNSLQKLKEQAVGLEKLRKVC